MSTASIVAEDFPDSRAILSVSVDREGLLRRVPLFVLLSMLVPLSNAVGCGGTGPVGELSQDDTVVSARSSTSDGSASFSRRSALLWQGFDHAWTYNHRVKRFGSFVRPRSAGGAGGSWNVVHSAASGTGGDTASFRDHFVAISGGETRVETGWVEFELEGREEELVSGETTVRIPLDGRPRGIRSEPSYHVFLNGFDLRAEGDPDKLMDVRVRVGDPEHRAFADALVFDVKTALRTDCSTPECRPNRRESSYVNRIHYLVVRTSSSAVHASQPISLTNAYRWGREREIRAAGAGNSSAAVSLRPTGSGVRSTVFGLKFVSASMALREDPDHIETLAPNADAMHLLEWSLRVDTVSQRRGRTRVDTTLFFKNWDESMRVPRPARSRYREAYATAREESGRGETTEATVQNVKRRFAYRSAGTATIRAAGRMLSFGSSTRVEPERQVEGTIDWDPNGDVASPDAIHRESVNPARLSER